MTYSTEWPDALRYHIAKDFVKTCKHCGHDLIISHDYEYLMYKHTETGSIYCWDENEQIGEPEIEEINNASI
jgi:hypothetical protein